MADSRGITLAVWAASLLSSHTALAKDDETYRAVDGRTGHQVDDSSTKANWYGEQILLIDVPATAAFIGGVAARDLNWIVPGLFGHVFAGPVVHWSHGRVGIGFASYGIRAGTMGVPLLLGSCAPSADSNCGERMAIMASVGMVIGTLLDISILAYDRPKRRRDARPLQLTVGPVGQVRGPWDHTFHGFSGGLRSSW